MERIVPCLKRFLLIMILFTANRAQSQQSLKSILINHGSPSCGSTAGEQQLFTGVLSGLPSILATCSNGIPFYSSFTAYNPKDKKIYFADISTANTTKMYAMDYNLGGVISCLPATTPTYTYNYGINQLCFDQDGNNLVIYNYNASTGLAAVKRIDVATGADIDGTSKPLVFPAGNTPNSLSWGDMVFMPNGRVFMTFGSSPSKLFELVDFDGPGSATAVFLTNLPHPCFSIGYVDGNLMVAGSDASGCYYYTWDIKSSTLSSSHPFPMGKSTADMTHMNVGLGVSEELIGGSVIDETTADIIYHVVVKNKGNIDVTNVQVTNALEDAFGAGNVSNVHISFVSNPAGLVLNPLYDGVIFKDMLLPGQSISNYPVSVDSAVIRIQLRANNLVPNQTYYSSSIASGFSGAGLNIMNVSDSSNNGGADMIDVDMNGLSDDVNEGIATPFMYNVLLPVSQLAFTGNLQDATVQLTWKTSQSAGTSSFGIERSLDGVRFTNIGTVTAQAATNANYLKLDNISKLAVEKVYYRLKVNDRSGKFAYSNTIMVRLQTSKDVVTAWPNPFINKINVQTQSAAKGIVQLRLYDGTGRMVKHQDNPVQPGTNYLSVDDLQSLAKGVYYLELVNGDKKTQTKLIK